MEELKQLFALLMPEMTKDQRRALVTSCMIFFFVFHIAWACGWVPGLPGFARADAVVVNTQRINSVMSNQNEILVRLIASDIENARQSQCKAIRTQNEAAMLGWGQTLRSALAEYLSRSHRPYPLRDCGEY